MLMLAYAAAKAPLADAIALAPYAIIILPLPMPLPCCHALCRRDDMLPPPLPRDASPPLRAIRARDNGRMVSGAPPLICRHTAQSYGALCFAPLLCAKMIVLMIAMLAAAIADHAAMPAEYNTSDTSECHTG